jgi:hypothetical protein
MAVPTSERTRPPTSKQARSLRGRRRAWWIALLLVVAIAVGAVVVTTRPAADSAPVTPEIVPPSVGDAIPGQRIVLLVTFTDDGGVTDPAVVTAATTDEFAAGVAISIAPEQIHAGEVAEVTVVMDETVVADLPEEDEPMLGADAPLDPADRPVGPDETDTTISPVGPEGVNVPVTVTLARGDTQTRTEVPINISRGEDLLHDEAAAYRDRFVAWLETERPDLGITSSTEWVGTPVQPHILVVSHYLFFSEDWEMSVMWHIMIAPHDWSRISLRPRDEMSPTLAFEIPSVSDPTVVEVEPPPHVDR